MTKEELEFGIVEWLKNRKKEPKSFLIHSRCKVTTATGSAIYSRLDTVLACSEEEAINFMKGQIGEWNVSAALNHRD